MATSTLYFIQTNVPGQEFVTQSLKVVAVQYQSCACRTWPFNQPSYDQFQQPTEKSTNCVALFLAAALFEWRQAISIASID